MSIQDRLFMVVALRSTNAPSYVCFRKDGDEFVEVRPEEWMINAEVAKAIGHIGEAHDGSPPLKVRTTSSGCYEVRVREWAKSRGAARYAPPVFVEPDTFGVDDSPLTVTLSLPSVLMAVDVDDVRILRAMALAAADVDVLPEDGLLGTLVVKYSWLRAVLYARAFFIACGRRDWADEIADVLDEDELGIYLMAVDMHGTK